MARYRIYQYDNCGTCRKAVKFLSARQVDFETVPIREQPPTKEELSRALNLFGGNLRKIFNTSGLEYKKQGLKAKLDALPVADAIDLLSRNGSLVKRPFVVGNNLVLVGFDEKQWGRYFHLK